MSSKEKPLSSRERWKETAILLPENSTKGQRTTCFNLINRAFSKDYFSIWKNDCPKEFNDIARFFIASILYIQHFPRRQRPKNAAGDGAYEKHLDTLRNMGSSTRKHIDEALQFKNNPLKLLKKIDKFWHRVEKKLAQSRFCCDLV